jgi:DNA-binding transcriptional ArsR family regulator
MTKLDFILVSTKIKALVDAALLALAAPRRREILALVRRRERSAGDIHRAVGGVTFGAVSQHLGVLERAGLVAVRRQGRSRIYRLRFEGLDPLHQWIESMWKDALGSLRRLAEAEESTGRTASAGNRGARPSRRSRGRSTR